MNKYMKRIFPSPRTWAVVLGLLWAGAVPAQETHSVYAIGADGLACPFCAYGIEKQLTRIESVEAVETDIGKGVLLVTMTAGAELDEGAAKKAVKAAGFTMRGFDRQE